MPKDLSNLAAVLEELRRDGRAPMAEHNLAQRFSSLLDDEELEEVFQEFMVPVQHDR
jgi:hypothetical protein